MKKKITILVPCYNEQEVLQEFCKKTSAIDDGSMDNTLEVLKQLNAIDRRNKYISLSRNFGKACSFLKEFRESERYTKGLFSLVGLKKIPIEYNREPRAAGTTKWNYLTNLAVEGITSSTTAPLNISTLMGFILAFINEHFILGEYMERVFKESKRRPLYFIGEQKIED